MKVDYPFTSTTQNIVRRRDNEMQVTNYRKLWNVANFFHTCRLWIRPYWLEANKHHFSKKHSTATSPFLGCTPLLQKIQSATLFANKFKHFATPTSLLECLAEFWDVFGSKLLEAPQVFLRTREPAPQLTHLILWTLTSRIFETFARRVWDAIVKINTNVMKQQWREKYANIWWQSVWYLGNWIIVCFKEGELF